MKLSTLFVTAITTILFVSTSAFPMNPEKSCGEKRSRDASEATDLPAQARQAQAREAIREHEATERVRQENRHAQNLTHLHEELRIRLQQARIQERNRNSHFLLLPPQQPGLAAIWEEEIGREVPVANRQQRRVERAESEAELELEQHLRSFRELFELFNRSIAELFALLDEMHLPQEQQQEAIDTLIARLPTHLPENDAFCAICQNEDDGKCDDGKDREWVRLPSCSHVYHKSCIRRWFMEKRNCPQCRCPITAAQSS